MKKILICLNFIVFSLLANANDTIVLSSNMYGIDHNKKLIVSNKNTESINTVYPRIKSVISLDANYTFSAPVQTIEKGHPYDIVNPVNNEKYTLYFTELPVIYITTPYEITDTPKVWASFTLTESNGSTTSSDIGIEIRGASSQALPKKSLEIEFWKDPTGKETLDFSLLGMRSDDDWNLQAMYNEPLRFLSKTGNDLWRLLQNVYYSDKEPDAINGIRMVYSELFINGEYRGIYAVSEKIDRKQLKLKNTTELSKENFIKVRNGVKEHLALNGLALMTIIR